MKTLLKLPLMVGLFGMGITSLAANNIKVEIEKHHISVEFQNSSIASTLFLKNRSGEILYREELMPFLAYRKNLSLEVVPSGTYYLNMDSENKTLTTVIIKDEKGIKIQGRNSRITFKPCFKIDGKKVFVFLTNPENMNSQLKIYDSNGTLMESLVTGSSDLRRTLDFSRVPPGDYLIKVKWGPHHFDKKIRV